MSTAFVLLGQLENALELLFFLAQPCLSGLQ
jgi:hypothetical protein